MCNRVNDMVMYIVCQCCMTEQPEEYKKGNTSFLGCHIDLSYRPLIPRVETEFWVGRVIADIQKKKERPLRVLDIFAGSGCVGIAVLTRLPSAHVDFAEKNKKFVEQIKKNLELNDFSNDRSRVIASDIFENISGTYDYIFANPPYIARQNKDTVQKSVLEWEEESTYFAEDDGLFYIKKLLDEASRYLAPKGKMYIEFDSWQKPHIEQYAEKIGWKKIEFWRDQYKRWRVVGVSSQQ